MALHRAQKKAFKRYSALLTAAVLVLIAQTVSAIHELDPQNQSPDHVCEVCVAASGADSANVSQTIVFTATQPAIESAVYLAPVLFATRAILPPSRGPPAIS